MLSLAGVEDNNPAGLNLEAAGPSEDCFSAGEKSGAGRRPTGRGWAGVIGALECEAGALDVGDWAVPNAGSSGTVV